MDDALEFIDDAPPSRAPRTCLLIGCGTAVVAGAFLGIALLAVGYAQKFVARRHAAALAETVIYEANVPYGEDAGTPLVLDIARPKQGAGPFPAVVCIHGGGWKGGDKSSFTTFIQTLAQRGYVAVTVKYRFAPQHQFPAQLEDVKCAVRYLRAHAEELNIDADRIGAMGGSAGGHLALMLGGTEQDDGLEGSGGYADFSSAVQAVGNIAGPTDLSQSFPELVHPLLLDFLGAPLTDAPDTYARASPVKYLSEDDPPVMLIHGTEDNVVPYEQATLYLEACQAAGVECELITINGGGHGFGGDAQAWLDANELLITFFDQHLKTADPAQEPVTP